MQQKPEDKPPISPNRHIIINYQLLIIFLLFPQIGRKIGYLAADNLARGQASKTEGKGAISDYGFRQSFHEAVHSDRPNRPLLQTAHFQRG